MTEPALPIVTLTDGAFYWVLDQGGWIVARNCSGYFYPAGCDYSVTPAAIAGPIPPPAPREESADG